MKELGGVIIKVSEYIKKYRNDNNISQQELANKLFVSKQAISKWENDKSLPDISLYPTLSSLLQITVDELMGNESSIKSKNKFNKKLIIIASTVIVLIIALAVTIICINPKDLKEKRRLKEETEEILEIDIPKISSYDVINFEPWLIYNNYIYPNQIYYLSFKNEIIDIDDSWVEELSHELIDILPIGYSEYSNLCDYYKLIDLTDNKSINSIALDNKKHEYALYCLQIENKRLVCLYFVA